MEGLRITQIAYFFDFVVFCLKEFGSDPVDSLLGETVEVAVTVVVVESVISKVILEIVFSGGLAGEVRSVCSGVGAGGLSGRCSTYASAVPATDSTTTATHTTRCTKVV